MTEDKDRDDALIAEKNRLAADLERMCSGEWLAGADAKFRRIAVLLRGDEQPKPDRAEVLAEELWPYLRSLSRDRLVPILNRHFDELRAEWEAERPAVVVPGEVLEQARANRYTPVGSVRIMARFILSLDGAKGGE